MKKWIILFLSTILLTPLVSFAETGILFIAHGTMKHEGGGHDHAHAEMSCTNDNPGQWESYVLSTVNGMEKQIPKRYEVAFGMWDSHCFDEAIHRLERKISLEGSKLDHLIVFPLFISSRSSVVDMQKYIFKKRPDKVLDIPNVHQTHFGGKITYMSAFDYDPQISMILANRFQQLIYQAKDKGFTADNMEVVLVMHGPVEDDANIEWVKMGEKYNRDITYLFPLSKSHVISLRDDADQEVRGRATKELRKIVSDATRNGKIALVLPLLVSKGGIDAGILKRLEGLEFIWKGEGLFPDAKLRDVISDRLSL